MIENFSSCDLMVMKLRTWKYIAKTEAKIYVTVIVSMVTVSKIWLKSA